MHPTSKVDFILDALEPVAKRHDSLLEHLANVSDEDPFTTLRLLQVYGINRFGHILSAASPASSTTFCEQRDVTITEALGIIQGLPVDIEDTTRDLPVVAGGAGLSSLYRTVSTSYMEAFFRVARPIIDHLSRMGGTTTACATSLLADPLAAIRDHGWAASVYSAHQAAMELLTIGLIAPMGNINQSDGDTKSVVTYPPPP